MTQEFHDPIPFASPANSSVLNSRYGQLDQGLVDLRDGNTAFNWLRLKASSTLEISLLDIVTPTQNIHRIDTNGGIANDNLLYIAPPSVPYPLYFCTVSASRVVTVKHLGIGGNIYCLNQADIVLSDPRMLMTALYIGGYWLISSAPSVAPTFDSLAPTTTKGDLIVRDSLTNTRLGVGANDSQIFADSGQATGLRWGNSKRALLTHDEANNVAGGASTGGAWTDRTLNTESDPDSIVSLSGNQFTPVSGKYRLVHCESHHLTAASNEVGRLRLRNVTAGTTVMQGVNARMLANQGAQIFLPQVEFTANGSDAYSIQYYVTTGRATNGLGIALNSGDTERYAAVILEKIG